MEAFELNLELVYKFRNIPGVIVECGVWKGGMIAGIAEILVDKSAFLFDSYEGLPKAKEVDGKAALSWQANVSGDFYFDNCSAEERFALDAMRKSGAIFSSSKGWFDETLPHASFNDSIAILRLDVDWFDSTMVCLIHLFPKVSKGGLIIIDDYFTWEGCSKAVHKYLSDNDSPSRVHTFKNKLAFIVKLDD